MTQQKQEVATSSSTARPVDGDDVEMSEGEASSSASSSSSTSPRSPEEEFPEKKYDQEPCYYSMHGKDRECRGIVFRTRGEGELKGFMSHDGVLYKTGDHVYLELALNEPYTIASITSFRYSKRDHVVMKLTRYYRVDEIPEISLTIMQQERNDMNIVPNISPECCSRELFSSETNISHPVNCLRGRIYVKYVANVATVARAGDFSRDNNTFFWSLSFNADSSRLAAIQTKIRVGNTYQAVLPPDDWKSDDEDDKERVLERDELVYQPDNVTSEAEQLYVRLARSYRSMTMLGVEMLDSQKNARVGDLLYNDAITQLHQSGYNVQDALEAFVANDYLLAVDVDFMTQDDAKKFTKGIKTYGKNFTRIQRELLPHHSREQLVSYYYLWKKTPEATKPKAITNRSRNPAASIKRASKNEKTKLSRPASDEYLDFESATESDVENDGASGRACHNCFGAESRDWHHANGQLMCTACRLHFKRYGQPRAVPDRPSTVPACLFKRTGSHEEEESGVRTRANKKEKKSNHRESMSEQPSSCTLRERKSPSVCNAVNNTDDERTPVKRTNGKRTNGKRHVTSTPNGHLTNGDVSDPKRAKLQDDEDEKIPDDAVSESSNEKEIKEEIDEDKPSTSSGSTSSMSCTTTSSSNVASSAANTSDHSELSTGVDAGAFEAVTTTVQTTDYEEDGADLKADSADDTWSAGEEVAYESPNALFVRSIVRSCGHRCSRSDYSYKFKEGGRWDEGKKKKEKMTLEKAAAAAAAATAVQSLPSTSTAPQIPIPSAISQNSLLTAAKKEQQHQALMMEMLRGVPNGIPNGMPHPMGYPIGNQMDLYNMLMHQQQQVHMAAAQQQAAMIEQQREMEKQRINAMRIQQQQQQQHPVAHRTWESIAAMNNMAMMQQLFGGNPMAAEMRLQHEMMMQQAAAAQAAQQQQQQQREREQREREQREKEAREQQAREQQAREQQAREQQAREQHLQQQQQQQQQQAAAAAALAQSNPEMHFILMMMQHQQQQQQQHQQQQQQQQQHQQQPGQPPVLPPGLSFQAFLQGQQNPAAVMNSDMMRRLQADAVMRPHPQ